MSCPEGGDTACGKIQVWAKSRRRTLWQALKLMSIVDIYDSEDCFVVFVVLQSCEVIDAFRLMAVDYSRFFFTVPC